MVRLGARSSPGAWRPIPHLVSNNQLPSVTLTYPDYIACWERSVQDGGGPCGPATAPRGWPPCSPRSSYRGGPGCWRRPQLPPAASGEPGRPRDLDGHHRDGTARSAVPSTLLGRLALTPLGGRADARRAPGDRPPGQAGRRGRARARTAADDGLLDGLGPRDTENVAASLRDLGRDTAIVATGRDPAALAMACGEVLTLADGIIVRNLPAHAAHFGGMRARARDADGSALRWTR